MAISLSSLKSTKTNHPPKILLYGVDGVGKTSLAAEFPSAVYLPTEGETPPSDVELQTPGTIESYESLLDVFGELLDGDHEFGSVIIDSLDGLEGLVWGATCRRLGINSIEEAGYGKGYIEADTEWKEYLQATSALARAGLFVVQLAHPEIVRFDSPTSDPYSRYSPKLHKRANALVREQSDIVAFMNYRISLKTADAGFNKKVTHAEGGNERLVHLNEKAGFVAKNRFSMPDSFIYKKGSGFAKFAEYLPSAQDPAQ
jgi:hypothetical protein